MDKSYLDEKYFIDDHVYNCPFCNRRNVSYEVTDSYSFDWTQEKKCFVYFVCCDSCENQSMHLSFSEIEYGSKHRMRGEGFYFRNGELDDLFFYSVPTSFFVLDKNIPKILRELITEAQGCLKSNFLTGASACV